MKVSATVLIILLIVATSCAVEGASWKLFYENSSLIKFSNRGYKHYIDTESIVANSENIVRAWCRALTYSSENDLLSDYQLVEMNCQERQYRIVDVYRVFHDTSVLKESNNHEEINKLHYLKPDEYDETLYKIWCTDNIRKKELGKNKNNTKKEK